MRSKKIALLLCQAKRDIMGLCPQKLYVPNPGVFANEFYSNGLGVELLVRLDYVQRTLMGFPGGASGKEPTCQCRRYTRDRLDPLEDLL